MCIRDSYEAAASEIFYTHDIDLSASKGDHLEFFEKIQTEET
jgi:hypothetical protein